MANESDKIPSADGRTWHRAGDVPFFACERELWQGNGLDTPSECIDASYSVHECRAHAADYAEAWRKRGWHTTVTGPHYPERHYQHAAEW